MFRVVVTALLVVVAGCDGGDAAARCQPADRSALDAIESGLTVQGGGALPNGEAVESQDTDIWFVGAEIDGPGIEEDGDVGVWAVTEDPTQKGSLGGIHAVNGLAREFSDWGAAGEPLFTMEVDGAEVAEDCLSS